MSTTASPEWDGQEVGRGVRQGPGPDDGSAGALRGEGVVRASGWQPLAGAALLDRLRVTGRARPVADAGLVADLRSHLERGVTGVDPGGTGVAPPSPVLVTTRGLTAALTCAVHAPVDRGDAGELSMPIACGALLEVLFRQMVTTGTIGDAFTDGLDALAVDERRAPIVDWVSSLDPAERSELRAEVDRQAEGLRLRWPPLDPAWLPRTRVCLRVPLAGGSVELLDRVDLVIGRPAGDSASVALVDVTSGARRPGHRADRRFRALTETLRSAVPPFAVATYYARTGELDVDPVTTDDLVAAARRCRAGIDVLTASASALAPSTVGATRWCAACATAPLCEVDVPTGPPLSSVAPPEPAPVAGRRLGAVAAAGRTGELDLATPVPEERAA